MVTQKFDKVYIDDTGNMPLITVGCNELGVGGIALPDPSSYDSNISTVVDGSRNVKGVYIGSVIRNDVAKISCKWNYLTTKQWADLLQLFNSNDTFTQLVKFYDASSGKYAVARMYISDRKAGIFKRDPSNNNRIQGWVGASLSLIEV